MANNKGGIGLIVGGAVVILASLFFLPTMLESEGEAIIAANEVENETGQDVLSRQDERLLDKTSTFYLFGFLGAGITLIGVGIWVIARR